MTIFLDDPRAVALREWLVENDTYCAKYGCNDRVLALYLAQAESDCDGLIEISALESVIGVPMTYRVTL